jgi:hypothetical protein
MRTLHSTRFRITASRTDGLRRSQDLDALARARQTDQLRKISTLNTEPTRFLWPGLKRCTRGFEKLARVYGGDVSRMLDITRFSLFFDSVDDITAALNIIMADEEVKVVRVRNRQEPGPQTLHPESRGPRCAGPKQAKTWP